MSYSGAFFTVSDEELERYLEAYPGVNLTAELLKMECWLRANPERRKKSYPRFIVNWLSRAHSRLLDAQVSTQTRELIRSEQMRKETRVGLWEGYRQ